MHEFVCSECETEFTVEHDGVDTPSFCTFCGEKLRLDKSLYTDWEDEEETRGC